LRKQRGWQPAGAAVRPTAQAAVRAVAEGRTIVMSGAVGASAPRIAEPLPARELQVLRSMAAGLRNADVAGELYVSVKTVEQETGLDLYVCQAIVRLHGGRMWAESTGRWPGR
jgi:FixJ family two-component response regulator